MKEPALGVDRKTLPTYPEDYDPLQDETFVNAEDPDGYRGVKKLPELHQKPYYEAIEAEWNGLIGIGTFQVVPVSEADGSKTFGCRWVLKKKKGSDGKMLHVLTNPSVVSVHFAPAGWTVESLLEIVANSEPRFNALIDTGALVTGLSNEGVARKLLSFAAMA